MKVRQRKKLLYKRTLVYYHAYFQTLNWSDVIESTRPVRGGLAVNLFHEMSVHYKHGVNRGYFLIAKKYFTQYRKVVIKWMMSHSPQINLSYGGQMAFDTGTEIASITADEILEKAKELRPSPVDRFWGKTEVIIPPPVDQTDGIIKSRNGRLSFVSTNRAIKAIELDLSLALKIKAPVEDIHTDPNYFNAWTTPETGAFIDPKDMKCALVGECSHPPKSELSEPLKEYTDNQKYVQRNLIPAFVSAVPRAFRKLYRGSLTKPKMVDHSMDALEVLAKESESSMHLAPRYLKKADGSIEMLSVDVVNETSVVPSEPLKTIDPAVWTEAFNGMVELDACNPITDRLIASNKKKE